MLALLKKPCDESTTLACAGIVDHVKKEEAQFLKKAHEIVKYREKNYLTKAKTFEVALKVAGDEIYELDTENEELREQICDKIDNEYVKGQIAF
jgi:hypothetical protein